ncbi:MAG: dihydroxyacetone kinase subunit DhaK [Atribacterota bacterium]
MKKLINEPKEVVTEMLQGMVKAHPQLISLLPKTQVVVRTQAKEKGKVAVISGGGSGHEPAHAGFVGKGLLDAAIAGSVFAAPSFNDVLAALKHCGNPGGVLFVVKNYTGDRMLFDMATEEASSMGIPTRQIVVADDVAIAEVSKRRGVAGTIFVHKIAGAAAEMGKSLDEVHALAERASISIRSMGIALTPCTIPGNPKPNFDLAEDEIEFGIGIHGEAGIRREKIRPVRHLVEKILSHIFSDLPLEACDEVVVLVNGMGATPIMELYIAFQNVAEMLASKKITVYRSFVGEFMTSLDMAGFSITLFKVDEELKTLLDYPCHAPAWIQPFS